MSRGRAIANVLRAILLAFLVAAYPYGSATAWAQNTPSTLDKASAVTGNAADTLTHPIELTGVAVDGLDDGLKSLSKNWSPGNDATALDNLLSKASHSDRLSGLLGKAGEFLKGFSRGLSIIKIATDLEAGQYKKAAEEFGSFAGSVAADFGGTAIAGLVCAAALPPLGTAICFVAVHAIVSELAGDAGGALGGAAYCELRPSDPDCSSANSAGSATASSRRNSGGSNPLASTADNGVGANGGSGQRGGSSSRQGGGVVVGSSSINVAAGNISTTASGGGSAVTSIGSITGGGLGDTNVMAKDIVTNGTGRRTETQIAPGGGTVSAGNIVNEGGNLTVGGNGMMSRDGRPCLDLYMKLCMVQIYLRPHNHPCAPTFIFKPPTNMCELPSDYDHSIGAVAP